MQTITLFLYDSLINTNLLQKHFPKAENIKAARLYGFIRVFNLKSPDTNYSTLNIEKSEWNQWVNGITIELPLSAFPNTKENQELVQVEVQDFNNTQNTRKAYVLRSQHYEACNFENTSKQKTYLQNCLKGAKNQGEKFLEEFKQTTFLGEQTLKELGY